MTVESLAGDVGRLWYEDYVEVILSGEEQYDERDTLYFDGSVDR